LPLIRTTGEIPFSIDAVANIKIPIYQKIAEKANELKSLGMTYHQIADALKVHKSTIKTAVLWYKKNIDVT
jgi:orotate phosphoribosyltransferase-like protein